MGVVIEAEHTCMSLRGARVAGARTVTSALLGQLRDDPASRAEFLALARPGRAAPMRVAVVGAGLAAASAVDELRERGHEGSIDLFGAEPHLPYHRPPLSKGVLLGAEDEASVFVHDAQWYADRGVALHLGTPGDRARPGPRVRPGRRGGARLRPAPARDRVDPAAAARRRRGGRRRGLPAHPRGQPRAWRPPSGPGAASSSSAPAGSVSRWPRPRAPPAATSRWSSRSTLPLLRVLGPEVAATFADLHRAHGVDLRLDARLDASRRRLTA